MNDIISKELLSHVLGFNVVYTEKCDHRDNVIGIWNDMNKHPIVEINIYELAHKCKEWALIHNNDINDNGYYIFNSRYEVDDYETKITKFKVYITKLNYSSIDNSYNGRNKFKADTEPEAIFKACQWILDNKEAN